MPQSTQDVVLTFYPLGNADTCRVDLPNGRKLLFDYANVRDANDEEDLRADVAGELKKDLDEADRDYYDVVAFTHADDDHVHGASEFFYLEHAEKYQGDGRIEIRELWVPAALIIETGLEGDARVIRQEARHRLKAGEGIRVFSRPEALKDWLEDEGLTVDARRELITDAGQIVPGFTKAGDGVEFFAHSPMAKHADDDSLVDRNQASLALQATFAVEDVETRVLLCGDVPCDVWDDIVTVTRAKDRDERLEWDVFKIPHHCSYKSLGEEKGEKKTKPTGNVAWLLEQGQEGGIIVSSSWAVPSKDEEQPPHFQAAECYRECAENINGEFVVTMEHPSKKHPAECVVRIDKNGATLRKPATGGAGVIVSQRAPRAGDHD